MNVTVITPSLPGREELLKECAASVQAQTVMVKHRVQVDTAQQGPQLTRNALAEKVTTEWLLPLDDDDLLDPNCVETLLAHSEGADIIYPFCRMQGRTDWCPNRLFHPKRLFRMSFIPVTALIKTDLFRMLNGYRLVQLEDWDLYQRAYLHGARFRCVPEVLWTYRFIDGVNKFQAAA